ncbi:MAG: RrF2 family transcriptional regulator [Anaerolineae bacterium]
MRFSAREQYGLRAMAKLAQCYGQGPVPLAEVAQAEDISLDYLEQVVIPLRRAGLLVSLRGARGGYSLAKEPASVTVGEIIRALEGTIVPIKCVTEEQCAPCDRQETCVTRSVWEKVRDILAKTLDSTTLSDLIGEKTLKGG